jgi:adenine-specific DNA-methyltransferase
MATGVPNGNGVHSATLGFEITYPGKTPADQVLHGQRANLTQVLSVPGSSRNTLIYGDNLPTLLAFTDDHEVLGKIRLIYIDPPYATRSAFQSRKQEPAYQDDLSGAHYLEFLRQRLIVMRELLAEDGSIFVHLDENMAFAVKVLMDEIFGADNFRNWITRKKCNPKNYTRKQYGNISDYIMFYTKSNSYVWNQPFEAWDETTSAREYQYIEEKTGRRYKKVPVHAPGVRNGATGGPWRGKLPPPGKHWQYTPERLDEFDARGEIYWSPTGNPRRKVYLDESKGIPVQDIWMQFKDAHNQNIRITGYPTEKNADLLRRIIAASSSAGDLVLDAFAGSGTTAQVSEELGRRWIAIDNSPLAIDTMVQRLAHGARPMGDFVRRANEQLALLGTDRVLRSGLDFFVEEAAAPKITPAQMATWESLLAVQVDRSPARTG